MKNILILLTVLISLSYGEVPSYMIYCDQEDYNEMITYWYDDNIEIDCTVIHDDTLYTDARIRLRGDSSRGYPKKSYRITFSAQDPLDSRTKWNFNSEYMDHTYIHSWLFAWIMEQLEYPCFEVDHARMYVNDSYIGLYIKTNPVDEQFLIEN
ncbi:MAG: CotH kinase family protein, partial [Candidatus Aegiribacteria sp.]|nr:CotH kinase family protein [Candidatus Aegiribacteria sp.]